MEVFLAHASPFLSHRSWSYLEHLGLAYLEKALNNESFETSLFDATWSWDGPEAVARAALGSVSPPLLAGFSVNRSNFTGTVESVRLLRRAGYHGHVTLGGDFPTFHFEKILRCFPEIDSIVLGYGELPLVRLCRALSNGSDVREVPGLALREDDGGFRHSCCPECDGYLDTVGIPRHRPRWGIARMITSRGCAWGCTFCSATVFDRYSLRKRYKRRPVDEVLAELDGLVHRQGVNHVWLSDMDFVGVDSSPVERFCKAVAEKKYRVGLEGDCRVDAVNEPFAELLKNAGFTHVFLGVESFVDRQTNQYRKACRKDRAFAAVDILRRKGIRARFGFIMFDKDTTLEELRLNHETIAGTVGYGALDSLANKLAILPGTRIEEEYLRDGEHCRRIPIDARNCMQPYLYYTQYQFRDHRVAFAYEAAFHYRNKIARLQALFDSELRSGRLPYAEHADALWMLRDHFAPIFERILSLASRDNLPDRLPEDATEALDNLLVRQCVRYGVPEEAARTALHEENAQAGERLP